jgi:hypothetical protein
MQVLDYNLHYQWYCIELDFHRHYKLDKLELLQELEQQLLELAQMFHKKLQQHRRMQQHHKK